MAKVSFLPFALHFMLNLSNSQWEYTAVWRAKHLEHTICTYPTEDKKYYYNNNIETTSETGCLVEVTAHFLELIIKSVNEYIQKPRALKHWDSRVALPLFPLPRPTAKKPLRSKQHERSLCGEERVLLVVKSPRLSTNCGPTLVVCQMLRV